MPSAGVISSPNGTARCWWCGDDPLYQRYHDREWGRPVRDDQRLFEKLCLEGFQAGLSWLTILRKREHFRETFRDFEIDAVARFTKRDVERALRNEGIVRHRGKIESAINNARRVKELVRTHGSLAAFVWQFEPDPASRPTTISKRRLLQLAKTPESTALSKALKQHGFSFVGPTTAYAFMQSMGIVNDHLAGCHVQETVERSRARFRRPSRTA